MTTLTLAVFMVGLLHYGFTKARASRAAYIRHLASSEESAKELQSKRIRELEIECGIVEAPEDPAAARLRDAEQFWASVDTGETYVPQKARSREWKNAHRALEARRCPDYEYIEVSGDDRVLSTYQRCTPDNV